MFMDGGGELSIPSKEVFRDLARYCRYWDDTVSNKDVQRWAGRRDVLSHIMFMLNFPEEDKVMYKGSLLDD